MKGACYEQQEMLLIITQVYKFRNQGQKPNTYFKLYGVGSHNRDELKRPTKPKIYIPALLDS